MPSWVVAVIVFAACVRSGTEPCSDGTFCPDGTRCVVDTALEQSKCAPPSAFVACEGSGVANGEACEADATTTGTCFGGACIPKQCGDLAVDRNERCDDGNAVSGDGCSAACDSDETCGNGIVDLALGEQCDDTTPGLAGDGCTQTCQLEYQIWRNPVESPPAQREGFGLATDPIEGAIIFGGKTLFTKAVLGDTWRWTGSSWVPGTRAGDVTPPRRAYPAIAYDDVRRRVVMFGGSGPTTKLEDTWEWDGVRWSKPTPAMSPPARSNASMACGAGRCLLVGGVVNGATPQACGPVQALAPTEAFACDAWWWDGTTWTRTQLPTGFEPRANAALAYSSSLGGFVLFGGTTTSSGVGGDAALADTWVLETATNTWTEKLGGSAPPPVEFPGFTRNDNGLLLLAGNQTWAYEGTPASWQDLGRTQPASSARIATLSSGFPIVVGTPANGSELVTYSWNAQWVQTIDTRPVGGGFMIAATYDSARGRMVILDHRVGTLEWDGTGWRELAPADDGPPQSYGTTLAYDARCGEIVRFGGAATLIGAVDARTFTTNGKGWKEVTGPAPPGRMGHVMAYDVAHDAIVVFGGRGVTALDDLWLYDGPDCGHRAWRQILPAPNTPWPEARVFAALAYDPIAQRSILFGGQRTLEDGALGDTWELELTSANTVTWTLHAPAAAPSARAAHAMIYEPRRGRIVLFGGASDGGRENDTWALDLAANTWQAIAAAASPSLRLGHVMSTDLTGSVVVVGGMSQIDTALKDLFRLTSENALVQPERCKLAQNDDDGDGLAGCDDPDCWSRCAPLCPPHTTCDAAAPRCGDGMCAGYIEDFALCPADCS